MKTIKIMIAASAVLLLPACTYEPAPVAVPEATYTLQELMDAFLTEEGTYFPVRTRANGDNGKGFFSVDDIPEDGDDIVIRGRVVSDDRSGNLYKTLVIQDEQHPEQALRLSVDLGSLSGLYPLGQLIAVRCNGLAIGKYATQPQLCVPAYNNNVDANNAEQKVGWAPGRIPGNIFQMATTAIGMPEKDKVVAATMTIDEITSADPKEMEGRLVRIENVFFNQKYADTYGKLQPCTDGDPSTDQNVRVFAPTTNFLGFPQGRAIEDGEGNWILVSTSEYADFAYMFLPPAEYTGTITGIVGNYRDNARYEADHADWSITVRSLEDIDFRNAKGELWPRIEWSASGLVE